MEGLSGSVSVAKFTKHGHGLLEMIGGLIESTEIEIDLPEDA